MGQEELLAKPCPDCGDTEKVFIPPPAENRGDHGDRIRCATCDRFFGFKAKERGEDESKGRSEVSKKLVERYSKGFCELCLRELADIPPPETLEGHHVMPVEKGGKDDPSNIQIVCTYCHKLIHQQRTYLGHYRQRDREANAGKRLWIRLPMAERERRIAEKAKEHPTLARWRVFLERMCLEDLASEKLNETDRSA